MTRLDEEGKIESKRRVKYLVDNLPPLVSVPPPPSVRNAPWFHSAGLGSNLEVYALPCYQIDKFSGKLMAARGNCEQFRTEGAFIDCPTVLVPSSGNFSKDVAGIALGYSISEVWSVMESNTPLGKIKQVEATGAIPKTAPRGISAIDHAYELAHQGSNRTVMNQYIQEGGVRGQIPTMEHLASEMWRLKRPGGFVFGAVTGSCTMLMGARRYLPKLLPSGLVKIFGVASKSKDDKVPAARSMKELERLRDIRGVPGFMFREEWKSVLDFDLVTSVGRDEAYAMNGELFRYHYAVGPTGALLTAGFYHLLRQCVERGELERLQNRSKKIVAVLVWMDSHYAYDDPDYRRYLVG